MGKLHLIMPMGGGGTRFGNKGFNVPKPLIELQGMPFLYWSTNSILKQVEVADITFVVLQEHIDKYKIDEEIEKHFPNARIHIIPQVLNGAVLTCLEGLKEIYDDNPILFEDCDHAFLSNEFADFCKAGCFDRPDAALLTFQSDNPAFSYAKFDGEGRVIGTVEKSVVSNEAICGAYYFKNKDIFIKSTEEYLNKCAYKEFFISGVYNELILLGGEVQTFAVDEHISFGTPEEYDLAVNNKSLGELL